MADESTKPEKGRWVAPDKAAIEAIPHCRNVSGSSAGAGSGNFHAYRKNRYNELARLREMEGRAETDRLDTEFAERKRAREEELAAETERKRLARLKKKQRKKGKAGGAAAGPAAAASGVGASAPNAAKRPRGIMRNTDAVRAMQDDIAAAEAKEAAEAKDEEEDAATADA
eukprot:TRINITY_DN7001_c1_g1_i2.p1 TRINITY_DN7001_c1_g1~~TRINITY_DN7001_c1_g1_i2.p1  ORF type:complete len:193 (+),score=107.17 TRINITY_DN7001_c1_g1_i2:67-579(+)